MSNQLSVFKNEEFGNVRTIVESNQVLFCGTDVAKALGYSNPRDAIRKHCKSDGVVKRDGVSKTVNQHGTETQQTNEMTFITEGNVYRLITHSKLPSAERFESWVFDEVLPSIRKYGAFMTPEALEAAMCNPDYLLKVVTALKKESDARIALEKENAQLNERIETDKPLVEFANHVSTTDSLLNMSQFAKIVRNEDIDIGRNRLISWLKKSGYLMPNGEPYQQYLSQGLFDVKEAVKHTYNGAMVFPVTLITGKGQVYFVDKLKKEYKEAK